MRIIFHNPSAAGKRSRLAALPGITFDHGDEVDVPAGLVDACLASGLFFRPGEEPGARPADNSMDVHPPAVDLRVIRGIGPDRALALADEDIRWVSDLAAVDERGIQDLEARLSGVSARQLRDWVEQARRLLDAAGDGPNTGLRE